MTYHVFQLHYHQSPKRFPSHNTVLGSLFKRSVFSSLKTALLYKSCGTPWLPTGTSGADFGTLSRSEMSLTSTEHEYDTAIVGSSGKGSFFDLSWYLFIIMFLNFCHIMRLFILTLPLFSLSEKTSKSITDTMEDFSRLTVESSSLGIQIVTTILLHKLLLAVHSFSLPAVLVISFWITIHNVNLFITICTWKCQVRGFGYKLL